MHQFQILVKGLNEKTFTLYAELTDDIAYVKRIIMNKTDISIKDHRLIYAGRQLEDGYTLYWYNVQKEATLHLVLKLRGSMDVSSKIQGM